MSNEKEIREYMRQRLNKQFEESFTFDEFSGGSLTTRPDLATFLPDAIIFTEIKSDKDSLVRYHSQIIDYKTHSNHVYAILDQVHYRRWAKIDKNVGYSSYCKTYFYKDKKLYYPNHDGSNLNREVDELGYYRYKNTPISILDFLWKSEVYNFIYFIKGRSKIIDEAEVIRTIYTHNEIIDMSHKIIYYRVKKSAEAGHKKIQYSNCKFSMFDVNHKEHKQILFDEIENDRVVRKKIVKKKIIPLPLFMQAANARREEISKQKNID